MKLFKISRNDRNGQRHDQHTADSTHAADKLKNISLSIHKNISASLFVKTFHPRKNISLHSYDNIYLAQASDRVDITVSNSGHGDHHPVDTSGYRGEARVLVLLDEEAEAGKGEASDQDQHQHQSQFSQ